MDKREESRERHNILVYRRPTKQDRRYLQSSEGQPGQAGKQVNISIAERNRGDPKFTFKRKKPQFKDNMQKTRKEKGKKGQTEEKIGEASVNQHISLYYRSKCKVIYVTLLQKQLRKNLLP